jgi:hypothetical protein
MGWKPIANAEQLNLRMPDTLSSLAVAVGDLNLPADATEVVLQVASANVNNVVAASAPVTYKLAVRDQPMGTDARPFADFARGPASFAGQTVVLRGRVRRAAPGAGQKYSAVLVGDEDGNFPSGLRFLADRDTAAQLDETDRKHQSKLARLTCVVGPARTSDGITVAKVRVVRCDYLEDGGAVAHSVPVPGEATDPLAALNRHPEKFSGRSLTVTGLAILAQRGGSPDHLPVLFDNLGRPQNLAFGYAGGLAQRVAAAGLKPNGLYRVRLRVTVGDVTANNSRQATVTITRIDILDPRDDATVLKTIE